MSELHPLDGAVLVVYLLGIIVLGLWMARRVRNLSDYFMPRRFGKAMMLTHAFGTGTASDQAVVVASATFRSGISGIWYQWLWMLATPFYWLIAPIMRRFRAVTTADVYALRFDQSVAVLFGIVGMANMAVKLALMLKGAGALVESSTGALVSAEEAMAGIAVLFVAYAVAGGLGAAIVVDFFQGILTVIFSFMLLPFVLHAVGGMSGIRATIQPEMLSLVAPGKIGWFFILMMGLQALVGIVAQPFIMGVCSAGRTEMDGRFGFMVGNLVKRICTMAWCLTGIAAVAWYAQRGVERSAVIPDNVYGDMALQFLPAAMPGLLGIFLAAMLSAVMSSCGAFMLSASGLFTKNIYRPLLPGKSERHYVWVGRGTALAVVAAALVIAYSVAGVVKILEIWFSIAPMLGITFWIGLFWRRATPAGVWAAAIAGFGTWFVVTRVWFVDWAARLPSLESMPLVWSEAGKPLALYEPWRIAFYMATATLAAVVVSLLTKPVSKDKLNRFYALIRTPVTLGEKVLEPCTLPEGVTPPPRRIFGQSLGLEIPLPSKISWQGFFAGWLAIAALIGGFVVLIHL